MTAPTSESQASGRSILTVRSADALAARQGCGMAEARGRRRRGSRRRTAARIVLTVLVALVLLGVAPRRTASAAPGYAAVAGGEVAHVDFVLQPGLLVERLVDPGSSIAQSALDSLGTSTAYASTPYPGETVIGAPPLLAGLLPVAPPDYPFYAYSTYPTTPHRHASAGNVSLDATSATASSQSTATDGLNRTRSSVSSDGASGEVVAEAESHLGEVDLGAGLNLSDLNSWVKVVRDGAGDLQRESELSIGRLIVLGQTFRVTPHGIELVGQHVPVGVAPDRVLGGLLEQLASQGVTVKVLEAVKTGTGMTSGAVQVTYDGPVPNYGNGRITYTLGRTTASIAPSGSGDGGPVGDLGGFGDAGGGDLDAVGGAGLSGPVDQSVAGPAPVEQSVAGPAPVSSSPSGVASQEAIASARALDQTTSMFRLYPILVVVAAALVLVTNLFRHFGVRLAWTS